jgi:hypothetical protein
MPSSKRAVSALQFMKAKYGSVWLDRKSISGLRQGSKKAVSALQLALAEG